MHVFSSEALYSIHRYHRYVSINRARLADVYSVLCSGQPAYPWPWGNGLFRFQQERRQCCVIEWTSHAKIHIIRRTPMWPRQWCRGCHWKYSIMPWLCYLIVVCVNSAGDTRSSTSPPTIVHCCFLSITYCCSKYVSNIN